MKDFRESSNPDYPGTTLMDWKELLNDSGIKRLGVSGWHMFPHSIYKNIASVTGDENIIEAADGEQAIQTYKTEKPDLVIMDITMPNKNGLDALKEIRQIDPNAVIVMCSAMGQESMVVEAIRNGAKDFIVKPFKSERIIKTVQGIIE